MKMFQGIKFGLKASVKTAGQMILSKISAAIMVLDEYYWYSLSFMVQCRIFYRKN